MNVFTINKNCWKQNCLPSLNDIVAKNPMEYNRIKRSCEMKVRACIRRDLRGWKPKGKCKLVITWGERRKGVKRDHDNIIGAGRKIINDALQAEKVIVKDDPRYIVHGSDEIIYVDEPFVRVEIVELEKE